MMRGILWYLETPRCVSAWSICPSFSESRFSVSADGMPVWSFPTRSPRPSMYLPCTSERRFSRFYRNDRNVESITYTPSTMGCSPIPTAPTKHLLKLNGLREATEATGCRFVCARVPRRRLGDFVARLAQTNARMLATGGEIGGEAEPFRADKLGRPKHKNSQNTHT